MSDAETLAAIDDLGNIDTLEVKMLKKENARLRRSRDEWRKNAKELASYLSSKGIRVSFTQE